jgi:hypothetical protein
MVSGLKVITKNNNRQLLSNDSSITIDAKHNEMINYFKNLQESIPSLKDELKKLTVEYNNKDATKKNDIEYILYRDSLKENILNIKNKINSISNNEELNNYYLNVGTLLHSYYENIENSKNNENNIENFEENLLNYNDENIQDFIETFEDISDNDKEENIESNVNKKENFNSVLHFFNNRERDNEEKIVDDVIPENKTETGVYTSMKISDFVKEESKFKKKNILDEYLQKIDPNYVSRIKIDMNICKCPKCDIEMILYPSDGIQICDGCGYQQNILIESDKPSFKDPPMEVCYFSYKRINHYNEFSIQTTKILLTNSIFNLFKNLFKFLLN